MAEIIGAVIGALLGGLAAWLLARRRPDNYILCEEEFNYDFQLPFSETRILYKEMLVDGLHLARIRCKHVGSQVIDEPAFTIVVNPEAQLLGATAMIRPERGKTDGPCNVNFAENRVDVSLDRIYPYSLNQETLRVDLLSARPITVENVVGTGTSKDGFGWAARFTSKNFSEIPLLSLRLPRRQHLLFPVLMFAGLMVTVFAWLAYLIWGLPPGLLAINGSRFPTLLQDPLFIALAIWTTAILVISLILGAKGWFLPLPVPFTKKTIIVRMVKRGTYFPWVD